MTFELGILFAVVSLLFWGVGDFLIQRSARETGIWETVFLITLFGSVIIFPFVYSSLPPLDDVTLLVIINVSAALLIASLCHFKSLKDGKISIVEPILALEVPVSGLLAFLVLGEGLEPVYALLVALVLAGIILVSLKSSRISRKMLVEKGTMLACVGAVFMGLSNFLVGFASRLTSPLVTIWFISMFILFASFFYLAMQKKLTRTLLDFRNDWRIRSVLCVIDNLAWVAFAAALVTVPIAIAVALSEGYIALGAFLGLVINKEKLLRHQKLGLLVCLAAAIALSLVY